MRKAIAITLVAGALTSCGYFNSLYNANRQFADAERARVRGDVPAARVAYQGSIDKAAKSYRKYPHGRWSDDALYLIARSRFELGEYPAARAAFAELLSRNIDANRRAGAHAYDGAAALNLAQSDALAHFDSAIAQLDPKSSLAGFAHLWRARALYANGDIAGAWRDLDAVTDRNNENFDAVQLERIVLATQTNDSTHARAAFAQLLGSSDLRRQLDTLGTLADQAGTRFGAASVRNMIAADNISLSGPARDTLGLIRAQLAASAGDTTAAHRELLQLAQRAALPIASAARVSVAQSRLKTVVRPEDFADLRALLLPAINNVEAQALIRGMRLVEVLVQRSAVTGQPLALFTAAEIARDELGAPRLARQLFTTYVDIAASTPWAGKALLAAIAVEPNAPEAEALRSRMATMPENPYTTVVKGESAADAYDVAEERLARSMVALRAEAAQLAQQQEGAVTRAVFVLDSLRLAAKSDTTRTRCGVMIDTLAIAGVRADSVRAACLRGDSEMVAAHLKIDTLMWNPATRDSLLKRAKRLAPAKRDTIIKQ